MEIRDNKQFTVACHALSAFNQAKLIAGLMCDLKLRDKRPLSSTLFGALLGYYARPFAKSNGIGRLSKEDIPEEHRNLHRSVIDLRNQVFLHTAANASVHGRKGVNKIQLSIKGDTLSVDSTVIAPSAATFGDICNLLDILILDMRKSTYAYVKKQLPETPVIQGSYIVELEDDRISLTLEK